MCGIGGILFSQSNREILSKRIKKMHASQRHRGPDDQQVLILKNHGFCHQRLGLLDLKGGKQPLFDTTKRYFILFNGEIYNHNLLRKDINNSYFFQTKTDTEVVLAAYLIWGESCLQKFIGMFSFFIWDTMEEKGFAARDPLGVKPFVYYSTPKEFIFASETKAISACLEKDLTIDEQSLVEFIVAPMLSGVDTSVLHGIKYLQAGEKLYVSKEGVKIEPFTTFKILPTQLDFKNCVEELRFELEESVRLSVQSDYPVATFLSGGLDSSILTALSAKHQANPFNAYTIKFENHQEIIFDKNTIVNSDDFPFAESLAKSLNIPLVPVIAFIDGLTKALKFITVINDRIPAWEQELSQHFLSEATSKNFKSVLVGDAADELNYGYHFLLNEKINYNPLGIINLFGGEKRVSLLSDRIQKSVSPINYLEDKYLQLIDSNGFSFNDNNSDNILAISCLIYKLWLGRLLHNGDIHTMNFGLEARVPFANQNILKVINHIGPEFGFKNGNEKNVLKAAAKGWIPEEIRNRRKSALPRDPRLGVFYQHILKNLIVQDKGFIDIYLNKKNLLHLCEQKVIEETDRMILFNMICLMYWVQHYVTK